MSAASRGAVCFLLPISALIFAGCSGVSNQKSILGNWGNDGPYADPRVVQIYRENDHLVVLWDGKRQFDATQDGNTIKFSKHPFILVYQPPNDGLAVDDFAYVRVTEQAMRAMLTKTPVDCRQIEKACADMANIKVAIIEFELDNGRLPTTAEGLQALISNPDNLPNWKSYLKALPIDPWGRAYAYRRPGADGRRFSLYCFGASGQDGNADNIWPMSGSW